MTKNSIVKTDNSFWELLENEKILSTLGIEVDWFQFFCKDNFQLDALRLALDKKGVKYTPFFLEREKKKYFPEKENAKPDLLYIREEINAYRRCTYGAATTSLGAALYDMFMYDDEIVPRRSDYSWNRIDIKHTFFIKVPANFDFIKYNESCAKRFFFAYREKMKDNKDQKDNRFQTSENNSTIYLGNRAKDSFFVRICVEAPKVYVEIEIKKGGLPTMSKAWQEHKERRAITKMLETFSVALKDFPDDPITTELQPFLENIRTFIFVEKERLKKKKMN